MQQHHLACHFPSLDCNRTYAILTNSTCYILEVKLLEGGHNSKNMVISFIISKLPEEEIGFHMERWQFLVKMVLSITINIFQGELVKLVGLDPRYHITISMLQHLGIILLKCGFYIEFEKQGFYIIERICGSRQAFIPISLG